MKKKLFKVFLVLPLLALMLIPSAINATNENVYEFDGNTFTVERLDVVDDENAFKVTASVSLNIVNEPQKEVWFCFSHFPSYIDRNANKIVLKYNEQTVFEQNPITNETIIDKLDEQGYGLQIHGGDNNQLFWFLGKENIKSGSYKAEIYFEKNTFTLSDFDMIKLKMNTPFHQAEYESNPTAMFNPDMTLSHVNGDTYTGELPYIASVNYDKDLFGSVVIDGETIDSSNYEVTLGSTVVTLKDDYMKSLSKGQHSININYANGLVSSGTFNMNYTAPIVPKPNTTTETTKKAAPSTSDVTNVGLIASIMTLAGLSIIITIKKQKA